MLALLFEATDQAKSKLSVCVKHIRRRLMRIFKIKALSNVAFLLIFPSLQTDRTQPQSVTHVVPGSSDVDFQN